MKNLFLTGLIIILCSCSNDDLENSNAVTVLKESVAEERESPQKKDLNSGKEAAAISAGNYIILVPAEIKNQVISVLREKLFRNGSGTAEKSVSVLDTISMDEEPVTALYVIVDESSLEIPLKADVKGYITSMGNLRGHDYLLVDEFIIQYEISKRADSSIATSDRQAILTISSMSEAVLFSDKPRKDRDWETSTTSKSKDSFKISRDNVTVK